MKDAYYFPHFCNARHDRKIKRLRKELGLEGYGIFFMLLEVLREQTDLRYPMDDLDLLADEMGTSEQKVRTVVCNYQLFDIDTSSNKDKFFSPKLLVYLQPYFTMKNQRIEAGKKSAEKRRIKALEENLIERPLNGTCNDVETDLEHSFNEIEQSKVKKSKVKEINKNIYDELFDSVWKLYPKKEGKGQVSEFKKKELYKLGYEQLERCIERYKKAKAGTDRQYLQNGSTFFNSGYVDYLDCNYVEDKPKKTGTDLSNYIPKNPEVGTDDYFAQ